MHDALAVQVVPRDAVDVHEDRLLTEGGQTKRRVLDPQLGRPAHAHGAAIDADAVRELRVVHRHAPREAQQVKHRRVLPDPGQPLPTGPVQLDRIVEESEVLRLDEEPGIIGTQRVYQLAEVQLELRGRLHITPRAPLRRTAHLRRCRMEDLRRCCARPAERARRSARRGAAAVACQKRYYRERHGIERRRSRNRHGAFNGATKFLWGGNAGRPLLRPRQCALRARQRKECACFSWFTPLLTAGCFCFLARCLFVRWRVGEPQSFIRLSLIGIAVRARGRSRACFGTGCANRVT